MKTEIKYHCGRHDLPVFGCHPKRITTAKAMNVLLDPDLDRRRVCISQPVAVQKVLLSEGLSRLSSHGETIDGPTWKDIKHTQILYKKWYKSHRG